MTECLFAGKFEFQLVAIGLDQPLEAVEVGREQSERAACDERVDADEEMGDVLRAGSGQRGDGQ